MELELRRHDWAAFTGRGVATEELPERIRELFTSTDPAVVKRAAGFVGLCAADDDLLADVSPAIAAVLVHGLWAGGGPGRDEAIVILVDIARARVSDVEPEAYGFVSEADCMVEIARAFPVYAEILEHGKGAIRDTCVDLIFACGVHDPWIRDRARFYLRAAMHRSGRAASRLADLDAADARTA
jgi:hypothetical protein